MNLSRPLFIAAALAFAFLAPASFSKTEEYKKVTFDEFFAGSVASIPLSLDIPIQYSYAEAVSNRATTYFLQKMTWAGHDFLDSMRDDTIWKKAQEKVLKPIGGVAFDVLKEWLKAEMRSKLGLPSGD